MLTVLRSKLSHWRFNSKKRLKLDLNSRDNFQRQTEKLQDGDPSMRLKSSLITRKLRNWGQFSWRLTLMSLVTDFLLVFSDESCKPRLRNTKNSWKPCWPSVLTSRNRSLDSRVKSKSSSWILRRRQPMLNNWRNDVLLLNDPTSNWRARLRKSPCCSNLLKEMPDRRPWNFRNWLTSTKSFEKSRNSWLETTRSWTVSLFGQQSRVIHVTNLLNFDKRWLEWCKGSNQWLPSTNPRVRDRNQETRDGESRIVCRIQGVRTHEETRRGQMSETDGRIGSSSTRLREETLAKRRRIGNLEVNVYLLSFTCILERFLS